MIQTSLMIRNGKSSSSRRVTSDQISDSKQEQPLHDFLAVAVATIAN